MSKIIAYSHCHAINFYGVDEGKAVQPSYRSQNVTDLLKKFLPSTPHMLPLFSTLSIQ